MGAVPELVRLRLATADKGRAALKSTRGISESPNVSMSKRHPHNEIHCASFLGLANEMP
jgi:hypothetical protein